MTNQDIVARLREVEWAGAKRKLLDEAAAEITRLRSELSALRAPADNAELVEVAARQVYKLRCKSEGCECITKPEDCGCEDIARAVLAAIAPRIRAKALEEAARECDEWADAIKATGGNRQKLVSYRNAAAAIRAIGRKDG